MFVKLILYQSRFIISTNFEKKKKLAKVVFENLNLDFKSIDFKYLNFKSINFEGLKSLVNLVDPNIDILKLFK